MAQSANFKQLKQTSYYKTQNGRDKHSPKPRNKPQKEIRYSHQDSGLRDSGSFVNGNTT